MLGLRRLVGRKHNHVFFVLGRAYGRGLLGGRGISARVLRYGASLACLAEVIRCLLLLVILPAQFLKE